MLLFNQVITGLALYAVFNIFGAIGLAIWTLAGVRKVRLPHIVTGKLLGLGIFATIWWWGTIVGALHQVSNLAVMSAWLTIVATATWWLTRQTGLGRISWPDVPSIAKNELSAVALLVGYLLFRASSSQLESTEKFMDLALLTGAVRAESFPYADFWRADHSINYYYFGYLPLALLLRLTGIAEPLGYNLLLGLGFVLGMQLSYWIVRAVTQSHRAGLLGSALAMLGGNLHFASCMASAAAGGLALETHCPYPKATRVLDPSYTINEMPGYSFFLGDLHPHVISIPFFLTSLFLIWEFSCRRRWSWPLAALLIFSLSLGAVVHAWDFMTLGALLALLMVAGGARELAQPGQVWQRTTIRRVGFLAVTAASPFLLYSPFFSSFVSPVAGVGFAPSFVRMAELQGLAQYPSGALFLFLFWGGLLTPALFAAGLLGWRAPEVGRGQRATLEFSAALGLIGLLLIAFTELFYFRDLFHVVNPSYFRVNTVFKFGFHAWMLLALAAVLLAHAAWSTKPSRTFATLCAVCFSASALFPLEAFRQLARPALPGTLAFARLTLEGGNFIGQRSVADHETIKWLREHEHGRPVLIEAFGDSYSYAGRIGVFSGAINAANWPTHQWTWRFSYPDASRDWHAARERMYETGRAPVDQIGREIRSLYEATEKACAQRIARELNADYLYVGKLERETYPGLDDTVLKGTGSVVFQMLDSYLVRIDETHQVAAEACR